MFFDINSNYELYHPEIDSRRLQTQTRKETSVKLADNDEEMTENSQN